MTTCLCGCGAVAPIAKRTNTAKGHVKGQPVRYLQGHGGNRSGRKSVPLADRFWDRVDRREPDECWPWTGPVAGPMGYGRAGERKHTDGAHRVAYKLANGPIPEGMLVRHACDNPPCCNPAHLLLGTPADNMRDRTERDRAPKGEQVAGHVLTERDVLAIRSSSETDSDLSRRFGVDRKTIRAARVGKTWKHMGVSA